MSAVAVSGIALSIMGIGPVSAPASTVASFEPASMVPPSIFERSKSTTSSQPTPTASKVATVKRATDRFC